MKVLIYDVSGKKVNVGDHVNTKTTREVLVVESISPPLADPPGIGGGSGRVLLRDKHGGLAWHDPSEIYAEWCDDADSASTESLPFAYRHIKIESFKKGSNSGLVIDVANVQAKVFTEKMPVLIWDGCLSQRIQRDTSVSWVEIAGKEFVIRESEEGWFVRVPWEVAEEFKKAHSENKCPSCGFIKIVD